MNGATDYEQRLAELGIDRGQLARGFEDIHRRAIGHEPMLLNADVSMVVKAPPLREDFTKLNGKRWTRAQRQGRKGGLKTQRKAKE